MARGKTTIRVTYRSGAQFDCACDGFKVTTNALGELVKFEVTGMATRGNPIPKFWNIAAIESVWELT